MVVITHWFFYTLLTFTVVRAQLKRYEKIPKNVLFGSAMSAYQSEGAWNEDGKGESIWDNYVHRNPSLIKNGATGDVACDSYRRYKEDIKLASNLGLNVYRFSISWSRVLPTGYSNQINQKGLDHYKDVVKEIIKYNMTPAVTIYHWDLPQRLYEDGLDWTNINLVEHIVNYARILIQNLPDVGIWFTINEPLEICHGGYGTGIMAPGITSSGVLEYQCSYVVLNCHAAIYRMFKNEFPTSTAKMTIDMDCKWIEPLTNSTRDKEAADRQRQFEYGLYFNAICNGDWPEVVKERINYRSKLANLTKSRLPEFTDDEKKALKGSFDFLSLNHYSSSLANDNVEAPANETSYDNDLRVVTSFDPTWTVESNGIFLKAPFGIFKILKWLRQQYGNHKFFISEIGMSDNGTYIDDQDRINFYNDYLCYILKAIQKGVDVFGVTFWNLIDDFEWEFGYSSHFGLFHIDFQDPKLTRTPKSSAFWVTSLTKNRKISCAHLNKNRPGPVKLLPSPTKRHSSNKCHFQNKNRKQYNKNKDGNF